MPSVAIPNLQLYVAYVQTAEVTGNSADNLNRNRKHHKYKINCHNS
jgi:hypothetical protein